MRNKTFVLVLVLVCLSAATMAGGAYGLPSGSSVPPAAAATPAPVTPSASPAPAPTPSPAPSPSPKPTSAPEPTPASPTTPTPDPWAAHFSPEGPYLSVKDWDKGPWVYRDETLSITVTIPKKGRLAGKYLRAEIYSRGPLPLGGFANNSKGRQTALPWKIARQNQAVLAVTGDYLTCRYNRKGVMIRGGVVYYDKKDAPTMAFLPGGEMKVYEPGKVTAKQLLALGVQDAFSFGPILVKGGKPHPSLIRHKLNYHAFRAAVGQVEPGHWVVIVTLRGPLLTDLAQLFIENKCTVAYNLDGGYSAAMVFMGNQLNKNEADASLQRSIPDMLIIGQSDSVPGEKDPVYATGIRKIKKNKPKAVEGWISR